jgi:hypothetical protein
VQCVVSALDATIYGFPGVQSISSGRDFGEMRTMFSMLVDKAFVPSLALLSILLRSLPSPVSDLLIPLSFGRFGVSGLEQCTLWADKAVEVLVDRRL